jgi:hypothetical protein
MRIKINLIGNNVNSISAQKFIFPVNLDKLSTIKDLKLNLTEYIQKNNKDKKIFVEELFIDNFLLPQEFEINDILSNNDEIK